jgi:hypothetical protein
MVMKRSALLTLTAMALAASACGSATTSGTPQTTGADDVVERTDRLASGSWLGARTTADGGLRIVLVAASEFRAGDPCTADYTASASETGSEVRVTVTARSPKADGEYGCNDLGYFRLIDVSLDEPLGARQLIFEPFNGPREVFDGSALLEPSAVPDGRSLRTEAPWRPDPSLGFSWQRTWSEPPEETTAGACTPGMAPISLTQGPADVTNFFTARGTPTGQFEVRGHPATYLTGGSAATGALTWTEGPSGMALTTTEACLGDTAPTPEALVRFANALE